MLCKTSASGYYLAHLESLGVITPVTEPTDWVSPIVIVHKLNGRLRVCIDPQQLNRALKHSIHPVPIVEELMPELVQAKFFA